MLGKKLYKEKWYVMFIVQTRASDDDDIVPLIGLASEFHPSS